MTRSLIHSLEDESQARSSDAVGPHSRPAPRPASAGRVPKDAAFVVNSFPKSGAGWAAAMLRDLLQITDRDQLTLSYGRDIEGCTSGADCAAAIAICRDVRDMVLAAFYQAQVDDRRLGYIQPRYHCIEQFYYERFLGSLRTSHRFYQGDLELWIDELGASCVPIIRYEDLLRDPGSSLRRICGLWNVEVTDEQIAQVVDHFYSGSTRGPVETSSQFIRTMFSKGDCRASCDKPWRHRLTRAIQSDISVRFRGYQQRLCYHDTDSREIGSMAIIG